jgi:hypothetical protein
MNQKKQSQNTKNITLLQKEKKDQLIHSKLELPTQGNGLEDSVMAMECKFGLMAQDMKVIKQP